MLWLFIIMMDNIHHFDAFVVLPSPPAHPPLPQWPQRHVSCRRPLPFKSLRGSGDIGKWDGRMFKLELVFISCLISWRLSPWLSAANPSDLSKAYRREQPTSLRHTEYTPKTSACNVIYKLLKFVTVKRLICSHTQPESQNTSNKKV